ncbi:MAG: nucleotidyltransferase domain-containing protein [Eubacterium sp.]|nr:nucleotidyltransferase domain-containing protein [Eubacterium sp.]
MLVMLNSLLKQYIEEIGKIYGEHLKSVILYGSYARGDFRPESDIDIMILLDLSDMEICEYRKQFSWITYDFYEEHDIDIKPIAKSEAHYKKWLNAYLFYASVKREGVELYGTA